MKPKPLVRARDVRGLLNWHAKHLALQIQVASMNLPEETLTDRKALSEALTKEIMHNSELMTNVLETNWQASWERDMGGRFVDAPNVEN